MFGILFLVLGTACGFTVLRIMRSGTSPWWEQAAWSMPVGLTLLTIWILGWSALTGTPTAGLLIGTTTAALCITACRRGIISGLRNEMTTAAKWSWTDILIPIAVCIPWIAYAAYTVPWLLFYQEDGALVAGWINTWGDWSVHLRTSTFFAAQSSFAMENPLFAGEPFRYSFLTNYLSSLLQRLGSSPVSSLTIPTMALFASLPLVLFTFAYRITGKRAAAALFVFLVLLAGGMGVYDLLSDLSDGVYFWEASPYKPLLYTDMRENDSYANSGIWFMNFIMSEFFPQRPFLLGLPVALYVLLVVWRALFKTHISGAPDKSATKKPKINLLEKQHSHILKYVRMFFSPAGTNASGTELVFTGFMFGILPLVHIHSFIALGIIIPSFGLYALLSKWDADANAGIRLALRRAMTKTAIPLLLVLAPSALIGFGVIFFLFGLHTDDASFHSLIWWVPQQSIPINPIVWWLRNAGPLIIVALLASWRFSKRPDRKPFNALFMAGLILFIAANFIGFQPWDYDNMKLLTYWYILWAVPAALFLANLWRWASPFTIGVLLLLTGAGLADALSVTASVWNGGIPLADKNGVEFARLVEEYTDEDPDALILIAPSHDHPVSLLSGRRIYVGYEGWLWTYGLSARTRIEEARQMYAATPYGLQLLRQRNIDYLVLGPHEGHHFRPNEAALTGMFPIVAESGPWRLLKVGLD